ncbi:MAG: hypothetical protein ABI383_10950 [Acidobacteriaceae bacterium]
MTTLEGRYPQEVAPRAIAREGASAPADSLSAIHWKIALIPDF